MHRSGNLPSDLGFLGFWMADFRTATIHASLGVRQVFQVPDGSTSLEDYLKHIHPDDRSWLARERPRSFGLSGWGVVEYRVIDAAGEIRWLMCRALYDTDATGVLRRGRGLMLDVTAFKSDGNTARTAPAPLPNPLQSAVNALLDAYEAADQVGDVALIGHVGSALSTGGSLMGLMLAPSPGLEQ